MTATARSARAAPPPSTSPRIIVVTGKGGVGKTTVAAATATLAARQGTRTLVVSTDPAHSLADVFDRPLSDEPTAVVARLAAQQLDARRRLEQHWGELRAYLGQVLRWAGTPDVAAEELTVLPGAEELLALTAVLSEWRSGRWDLVVVDCAPTAETMRLLSLPDVLSWWMDRLFPIGRRVSTVLGPAARTLTGLPIPVDGVWSALDRLYVQLRDLRAVLTDAAVTSVRVVTTAEKVVVAETRRTATYLSLFGLHVDAVVANRLLPEAVTDPFFDRWRAAEAEQLRTLTDGFAPIPVLQLRLGAVEPTGTKALHALAKDLYGARRAAQALHDGRLLGLTHDGPVAVLSVELGFAERGDVDLSRVGGELVVTVGPYRRAVTLPDSLAGRPVIGAGVHDGRLDVRFGSAQ